MDEYLDALNLGDRGKKQDRLSALPNEVKLGVLELLDARTLAQLQRLSKRFQSFIKTHAHALAKGLSTQRHRIQADFVDLDFTDLDISEALVKFDTYYHTFRADSADKHRFRIEPRLFGKSYARLHEGADIRLVPRYARWYLFVQMSGRIVLNRMVISWKGTPMEIDEAFGRFLGFLTSTYLDRDGIDRS